MFTIQKAFLGITLAATAIGMAACGGNSSSAVQGKFAPPSEELSMLKSCVAEKLGDLKAVIAPEISVCRRSEAGEVTRAVIQPSFYLGQNKGKIRVVQVVSVHLSYAGLAANELPSAEVKSKSEQAVRAFLMGTCEPALKSVMKRSGFHARYAFQMFQPDEEFANADTVFDSSETLFGEMPRPSTNTPAPLAAAGGAKGGTTSGATSPAAGQGAALGAALGTSVTPKGTTEKSSEAAAFAARSQTTQDELQALTRARAANRANRSTRRPPNFVLEILLGADQGITIKDHPRPVSSGPLAAPNATASHAAFCAQLAARVGEYMGLGGLSEEQTCTATDESPKDTAQATKEAVKNADQDASKPEPATASEAGLMKSGRAGDISRARLSKGEVLSVMKPVCGDVQKPSNATEKSLH